MYLSKIIGYIIYNLPEFVPQLNGCIRSHQVLISYNRNNFPRTVFLKVWVSFKKCVSHVASKVPKTAETPSLNKINTPSKY